MKIPSILATRLDVKGDEDMMETRHKNQNGREEERGEGAEGLLLSTLLSSSMVALVVEKNYGDDEKLRK